MQKLFVSLSILFLLLQSCSSSDGAPTPPDEILVKKITDTSSDGVFTSTYTYDGKKMMQFTFTAPGSVSKVFYTYTGNLITKSESFNSSNTLTGANNYSYTDDRLSSFIRLNYISGKGWRVTYAYNPDGSISATCHTGDLNNQNTLASTTTITLSGGEMSSIIYVEGTSTRTTTFTYDAKNDPFKNVIGWDKIAFARVGYFMSSVNHNLVQWQTSENGGPTYTTDQIYTYNSNDFPVTHRPGTSSTGQIMRYYY